jgi:hypothetical protein
LETPAFPTGVGVKLNAKNPLQKEEERFLTTQADRFPTGSESSIAGAKGEEKVGLLRSVP